MKRYVFIFLIVTIYLAFPWIHEEQGGSPILVAASSEAEQTTLYIYSNVSGFDVYYDGVHLYTVPSTEKYCWFYSVTPGRHTITLKKSGCTDVTESVDIVAGVKNEVTINMSCEFVDTDSDGVQDPQDDCYNPGCTIVDSSGCPQDSDGDGVTDCDDKCPLEYGEKGNGCPQSFPLSYIVLPAILIATITLIAVLIQRRKKQQKEPRISICPKCKNRVQEDLTTCPYCKSKLK